MSEMDPFLMNEPYYPGGRPGNWDPNADPSAGLPPGYRYIGFEGAIADQNNVVVYEPSQGWVGQGPAPAWVAGLPQVGIANENPVVNLAPAAPTPPVAGAMAPQMPQQPARRPLGVLEDQGGDADGSRGAPGGGGTGAPISSTEGSADYFAGDPAEELGGNPADRSADFWGSLEGIDVGSMLAKGFGKAVSYGLKQIPVVGDILSGGAALWDAIGRPPWQTEPEENRLAAARSAATKPGASPGAGTAPTDPWSEQALQRAENEAGYGAGLARHNLSTMSALDREEAGGFYTPGNQGAPFYEVEMMSAWDPRNSPEVENSAYYSRQHTMPGDRYASFTGRPSNFMAETPGSRASMSFGATPDVNSPLQDWVAASQARYGNTYGMSDVDMVQDYQGGKYNRGFDWQGNDITPASAEGGSMAVAPGSLTPSREYDWYGGDESDAGTGTGGEGVQGGLMADYGDAGYDFGGDDDDYGGGGLSEDEQAGQGTQW